MFKSRGGQRPLVDKPPVCCSIGNMYFGFQMLNGVLNTFFCDIGANLFHFEACV